MRRAPSRTPGIASSSDSGRSPIWVIDRLRIAVDGITVPEGKALTLRGSAGGEQRPQLITKIPGAPGISASAPLTLEYLDFHIEPAHDGAGIVQLRASAGSIRNCRFTCGSRTQRPGRFYSPRLIELFDGGSLEVSDSEIDSADAIAFGVIGTERRLLWANPPIRASPMSSAEALPNAI